MAYACHIYLVSVFVTGNDRNSMSCISRTTSAYLELFFSASELKIAIQLETDFYQPEVSYRRSSRSSTLIMV